MADNWGKIFNRDVRISWGGALYVNDIKVIDEGGNIDAPVTTTNLTTTGNTTLGDAVTDTTSINWATTITSTSASSLAVGLAGATNPSFVVDSSTGSQAAGLKVTWATAAGTVAIAAISSGSDASLSIAAKGVGNLKLNNSKETHATTAAINATATATAAEVATGWITSTSAAGTSITLPSGTDLWTALGAVAGTVHELYIDNTAGANTVTIIAGTNGVLSTAGVDTAWSFGDLTVASWATGLARFTIMFSSATAYAFTRTA